MGALTSWGLHNKVITQGYNVHKDGQLVFGTWYGTSVVASAASVTYGSMWQYTRTCTYSYQYVGMDLQTAQDCASKMNILFSRAARSYIWDDTAGEMGDWVVRYGDGHLMAKIAIVHREGKMWDVMVDVNEKDVIMSKREITPTWAYEDSRDYDWEKL